MTRLYSLRVSRLPSVICAECGATTSWPVALSLGTDVHVSVHLCRPCLRTMAVDMVEAAAEEHVEPLEDVPATDESGADLTAALKASIHWAEARKRNARRGR